MVSLLGNYTYHFPKPKDDTSIKIMDLLENTVEEKYYLHSDKAKKLIEQLVLRNVLTESTSKMVIDGTINNPREKEIANCILTRYDCGVSNFQSTGNMVVEKIPKINVVGTMDYTIDHTFEQVNRVYSTNGISPTVTCTGSRLGINILTDEYRIRKLTPRECGRLMGVADADITKMQKVNSNYQLYKQLGNSIVVDVLCAIFKQLNIEQ